jgi:transposase
MSNQRDENSAEEYAITIGIDWSDRKHDLWVRDAASSKAEYQQLKHTPEAIATWVGKLRKQVRGARVAIGLEQSKGALIYALMGVDFIDLYPINPQSLANYRKTFQPSGAKDDPTDAELIEDLVYRHRHRLRVWKPEDMQTRKLRLLCEKRRKAVNLRTSLSNLLTCTLKEYYPQALELIGEDTYSIMACDFILKWSTLKDLKKARVHTLRSFYYGHNSRSDKRLEQRLELIKSAVSLTEDEAVVDVSRLTARMLAEQLRLLHYSIKTYEKEIAAVFARHPDRSIFDSFPGAGAQFAPRLLTAFGSDRDRWDQARDIQQFSGVAPVMERSGNTCWIHKRWACPKFIRQSFHEYANESIRRSVWARAYYEQQRAKGKKHHTAIRSLAFKWIRIMHRCWKDRTPYNEMTYIRALQERGSALLQYVAQPYTANIQEVKK